jgi:hypothetical protein
VNAKPLCACENESVGKRAEESAPTGVDAQQKQAFCTDFHKLLERAACECGENEDASHCCGRSKCVKPTQVTCKSKTDKLSTETDIARRQPWILRLPFAAGTVDIMRNGCVGGSCYVISDICQVGYVSGVAVPC